MTKLLPKAALGAAVIIGYTAYSLNQRAADNPAVPAAVPTNSAGPAAAVPGSTAAAAGSRYRDGNYTGPAEDALYGNIQVKAAISNGRLTAVTFLQYPNDQPNSLNINGVAMPILQQEAIAAQSAQVDTVTGATDTSQAFVKSLGAALSQAE